MAADSALIVVSPSDNVDTIIQKVRGAGTGSVELLVPDGTQALQALGGFARLRQSLERDRIGLLVISSDEKTLNAARLNQLDTMGVQGARVTLPDAPGNGERDSPYLTQPLSAEELELPTSPPISKQDAEFLNALDEVSAQNRYADLSDEDAEMFAALDDLSDAIQRSGPTRRGAEADDRLAEALDEWDAATNEARAGSGRPADEDWDSAFATDDVAPRRRLRPEDIDLSDDDMRRQRGARRTEALRDRAGERATPVFGGVGRRRSTRDNLRLDLEEAEDAAGQRQRMLTRVLPLVLLLLLLALPVVWYFSNRTTVTVTAPAGSAAGKTFDNEVIPITSAPTGQNASAVEAVPVSADAEFTAQGQVISETLSPASSAKGVITLINTIQQPIQLPAGTELVGTNPQGQEVRFTLDVPATVPPAVTTTSVTGTSTQYGTMDVGITARSPGSASNVGENSIKQIIIPGQQPIVSDSSNFLIRHGPIGGGADQPQRVVTNDDVQRVLGEALTGLYNAGVQALRSKIDESKQSVEAVSIYPDPQALSKPTTYEAPVVSPPVGQVVDPNNPTFSMTVRAHFTSLAAPIGRPLSKQLETVGPQHFSQLTPPPCKPGEQQNTTVANPRWDGTSLTVDATITCTSAQGLPPSTLNLVRDAVRGRSRADAEEQLQELQRQGLIGSYTLPPGKDQFPSFDPLLDIRFEPVGGSPAQPTPAAQPTQGAP